MPPCTIGILIPSFLVSAVLNGMIIVAKCELEWSDQDLVISTVVTDASSNVYELDITFDAEVNAQMPIPLAFSRSDTRIWRFTSA